MTPENKEDVELPWPLIERCADFTKGDWPDEIPLQPMYLVPEQEAIALHKMKERYEMLVSGVSLLLDSVKVLMIGES